MLSGTLVPRTFPPWSHSPGRDEENRNKGKCSICIILNESQRKIEVRVGLFTHGLPLPFTAARLCHGSPSSFPVRVILCNQLIAPSHFPRKQALAAMNPSVQRGMDRLVRMVVVEQEVTVTR